MADNNSPWGPKGGSGDKGNGNSPWGTGGKGSGGKKPTGSGGPDRSADLDNVIEGFKARVKSGGPRRPGSGGGGGGDMPNFKLGPFGPLGIVLAIGAVLLISTSVYTVDQTERALVLRFGDYVRTEGPGLKFKLPSPIETTYKQETEIIRKDAIGGNDASSLMLTGDENIVDIDFTVLWRISDLANYYFEVENPAQAVEAVAESAMREVIGQNELEGIITTDRLAITTSVRDLMQNVLDEYKTGVRIVEVQLQKADAPDQGNVVDAFRDVVDAAQERETTINEATSVQNDVVPRARGDAAQILQEAAGYRDSVIAEAKGEAERFNLIYQEYRLAPVVTRQRMYLETIEEVYAPAEKIILDSDAGTGIVPYLPLDKIGANRPRGGQ
ncbi:protease modulator HflK [Algimonas arctica]|uniref:Protein HflK n=1 Tax=Algimonas arctica TaxID=1479486 RepID=A0A8J3G193_9PROT|nr:FtsH protease activity modulator HflK [Algimonas arctica]GHA83001.1 protease modulator HflK [Algimonas arctica]